jgi:hypothetical protein
MPAESAESHGGLAPLVIGTPTRPVSRPFFPMIRLRDFGDAGPARHQAALVIPNAVLPA